jgi:hypothetical protein
MASAKLEPDFSAGCAGKRIGHLLFATHPDPGIREWLHAGIALQRFPAALSQRVQ